MKKISRRNFLKLFGGGALATSAALAGCGGKNGGISGSEDDYKNQVEPPIGKMSYRENPKTKEKVSLLGYGMMRLPTIPYKEGGQQKEKIDQEMVNKLVDYAIEHGVNYFDTSPAYCQGMSEASTGIALHKHPREKYFVATKLSNFNPETWSKQASIEMYHNSMKELQVDYIDYYLLHAIGGGGMDNLRQRYLDNGILDFLLQEREAGRIRNLGFSYHGDIEVFDYLLEHHDKYKWDFVQVELNYLDWDYANEINDSNTDANYLYAELQKRGIPAVIMEPLLGGRLAKLPQFLATRLKQRDSEKSIASWAFRYAGSPEGVLTVLSGMTYMEHLKDNLLSYCPLVPVTEEDKNFLYEVAKEIVGVNNIPCNDCKYCMPCPYGIDIPAIFVHYNKCKNEGRLPVENMAEEYVKRRREYLIGLDRAVPRMRQANHCIGCGQCEPHCPQNIRIPRELHKIDEFVENLRRNPVLFKGDEQQPNEND
ncbi:MAG: aldo/keto reductase [Prevotella sp.]|nr:aldo/keto reductase [Prevotella sp.]